MTNDNSFFKPTALYREFMILDFIEKNPDITQRMIGEVFKIAVSMVNNYLNEYEKKEYLKRNYLSTKTVKYKITKKGIERKKVLNIWYLKSSYNVFQSAKNDIVLFLNKIIQKGFNKILLYGAGEVAEIILNVINSNSSSQLKVVAVIDDDPIKEDQFLVNTRIISNAKVYNYQFDGILISSYTHHEAIYNKLKCMHFPNNKIIQFFENYD